MPRAAGNDFHPRARVAPAYDRQRTPATIEGIKFRRQQPIGRFVADFACWEARLVVELDGGQHAQESDAARTREIEAQGWQVLRFWNGDVIGNLAGVLEVVATIAKARIAGRHGKAPSPCPSP